TLSGDGAATRIEAVPVNAGFFDVMGVEPMLGRVFTQEDDRHAGRPRQIVLGHALWRARFGAGHGVTGSTISLDQEPFVVAGVMPAGFDFPFEAEAWVPAVPDSPAMAEGKALEMIGRLKPGVTIEQARADLEA